MEWYYAESGQQRGPVSEAEFEALQRAGTVRDDTLVWREGMSNWQAHGQVRGGAAPAPPSGGARGVVCSQCGGVFGADQVIRLGEGWVCAACKPAYLQRLKEGTALPATVQYGGFWMRLLAKFIDWLIVGVPLTIVFMIIIFPRAASRAEPTPMDLLLQFALQLAMYAVNAVYTIFFVGKYGATPGKMACRLRIMTAEGGTVSYGRATGRFFAEILSGLICYIGYLIAGFDEQKRALHDHICNTRVIKT
jgi:uncharacterized RDD family membrane protein YckC